MQIVRLFLPYLLIFTAFLGFPHLLSSLSSGSGLMTYNEPENGASILQARETNRQGDFADCDIYFIGTSRTMADYDPSLFADKLQLLTTASNAVCAINLGNLGNSPVELERSLQGRMEKAIVILEFSPHIFYDAVTPAPEESAFKSHEQEKQLFQLRLDGLIRDMFNLEGTLRVDPAALYSFAARARAGRASRTDLYPYLAINAFGSGQFYETDGQVRYRSYLQNSEPVETLTSWIDTSFDDFQEQYTNGTFNEFEWEAYVRVIQGLGAERVVVVRPPISERLYEFENEEMNTAVSRILDLSEELGVAYVDLNPSDFFSLDESHVDWFETARLTEFLFSKLDDWLLMNYLPEE